MKQGERIENDEECFQKGNRFFENQKYSIALDWYSKVTTYYDHISTHSKIQNELAIVKSILNISEHAKPSQIYLDYLKESFIFLHKEDSKNLTVYFLEIEFNILNKDFQKSISILDKCVEEFGMIDELILLYIISYNESENNSQCLKYFELLDLETSDEFKKEKREIIIEQKSTLYIKTKKFGKIFKELYALDMLQNEKYLQYNLMLAKAMWAVNLQEESLAVISWLLSKDFHNHHFWNFLCDILQNQHNGLLATAQKWVKITSKDIIEENFEMNSNQDSQLIHFLKSSQLTDGKIDEKVITEREEGVGCKYHGIGYSIYELEWHQWVAENTKQAEMDKQEAIENWNKWNPHEKEKEEDDEYSDGFAREDPITREEFEDPALHANWDEELFDND